MVSAVVLSVMSLVSSSNGPVQMLERPDGKVAFEDLGGSGPLVVCVPGMGDVRAQYRLIAPRLKAEGYRVVVMDLRGLGDSTSEFKDYSARAVGEDMVALIKQLGVPRAFIMGNSMAAAAAVWAAAELPDVVEGLILTGPFVRDVPAPFFMPMLLKGMFAPPWGAFVWSKYYATLYPTRKPADLDGYAASLKSNLGESGRKDALMQMFAASKADCEARIPQVKARTLVVMGSKDPDFSSPVEEAELVAQRLKGEVLMVEGAGHYPHVDSVDVVAPAVIAFLKGERHGS